jgi:hypothetical protein
MMITSQGIIISNNTARLWPILIIVEHSVSKIGKFPIVFLDIENV